MCISGKRETSNSRLMFIALCFLVWLQGVSLTYLPWRTLLWTVCYSKPLPIWLISLDYFITATENEMKAVQMAIMGYYGHYRLWTTERHCSQFRNLEAQDQAYQHGWVPGEFSPESMLLSSPCSFTWCEEGLKVQVIPSKDVDRIYDTLTSWLHPLLKV